MNHDKAHQLYILAEMHLAIADKEQWSQTDRTRELAELARDAALSWLQRQETQEAHSEE